MGMYCHYTMPALVGTKGIEPLRHKSQKFEFCTSTNSVMSPFWRFRSESNRRSRSCSPTPYHLATEPFFGRDSWGRTSASGSQSPLPYHLATSLFFLVGRAGFEPANSMRADLQSAAFTRLRYLPSFIILINLYRLVFLAENIGLEPMTLSLTGIRSTC